MLQLFMTFLCGDIGASNSRLAILEFENQKLIVRAKEYFKNSEFNDFESVVARFLTKNPQPLNGACFGVAGPVIDREVDITNLSWKINADQIAAQFKLKKSFLLNDLEAIANGVSILGKSDLKEILKGNAKPGPQAVIAPGSGIGEAILYWDGKKHWPMPTEGGHTSFSPTSQIQIELLQFLFKEYGHVSWERVLSGPGIFNIYRFLRDEKKLSNPQAYSGPSASAEITDAALRGENEICLKTVELFFEILATEAANLALKCLPTAGLFIAGGITPKLVKLFDSKKFQKDFLHKGRMSPLLECIPVSLILNDEVGILGAAQFLVRQF